MRTLVFTVVFSVTWSILLQDLLFIFDIFSDAVSEGLIKDGFGVVTVFDNVSGDAGSAEALLIDSIPDALAWNKNKGGANLHSTHSNQMVLYICAFQIARKDEIIHNKKCVKMANGTDAVSMGTNKKSRGIDKVSIGTGKVARGTDKKSMGIDKVSMGTAKLPSSKEIPNAHFELTCKQCNKTRWVDSVNGKVKIEKSGSKYVLAKNQRSSLSLSWLQGRCDSKINQETLNNKY
jgi:hypothetical protein